MKTAGTAAAPAGPAGLSEIASARELVSRGTICSTKRSGRRVPAAAPHKGGR